MKSAIMALALAFALMAPVASVGTPNGDDSSGATSSVGASPAFSLFC